MFYDPIAGGVATTKIWPAADVRNGSFPFGQPVLPRAPSASAPRPVYVLGAYPSSLHVEWVAPAVPGVERRKVRALLVDNEPTPFWSGERENEYVAGWLDRVQWSPAWGQARPPKSGTNGPSGHWVACHILRPIGVGRRETCISDCLDTARLNASQAARVNDTYTVAEALGLPTCTVPFVPTGERGIVSVAAEGHLDRLRQEISQATPQLVVTLGNAALRVFGLLAETPHPQPLALARRSNGQPLVADIGGHRVSWLPLVHPRSGERTPPWPDIHAYWEATASTVG